MSTIIDIQNIVEKKLQLIDLFPKSIVFTYEYFDGLLSISFFTNYDLHNLLCILDYENQCDKGGYIIIEESNTIMLKDSALLKFYTHDFDG